MDGAEAARGVTVAAHLADEETSAASDVAVVHGAVRRATQKQSCKTRGRLNPRQFRLVDVAQEPGCRRTKAAAMTGRWLPTDDRHKAVLILCFRGTNTNDVRLPFPLVTVSVSEAEPHQTGQLTRPSQHTVVHNRIAHV